MDATLLQHRYDPNRKCDDVQWICIDYALCNGDAHIVFQDLMKHHNGKNIVEIFKETCRLLEIKATQIDFVDITKFEDKNVICFYWLIEKDKRWNFSYIQYHFLRKIHGTWSKKDGHNSKPYLVPFEQLETILNQLDPENKTFFVIE